MGLPKRLDNACKRALDADAATYRHIKNILKNNLDKNMFPRLATVDFIDRNENIIICGLCGTGKSYLSRALGHQGCMMEHKTVYANTARLLVG